MQTFITAISSISGYVFFVVLLSFIAVFIVFQRAKKQGQLSKGVLRVNKQKFIEIRKIVDESKLWFNNTYFEKYTITAFDKIQLKARYYPNGDSKTTIICMHGYKGSYDLDFAQIAPYYHSIGYNVLLLQNRAHGKSGGKFIGFSVKDKLDLFYWINTFNSKVDGEQNIFIHGMSMGAATSMNVVGMEIPSTVKGIISDCGFICPLEQIKYLLYTYCPILFFPIYLIFKAFTKLIAGNDLTKANAIPSLKNAKVPMMFIHGARDLFVPSWMSKKAYKHCASEKSIEIFNTAGHTASQYTEPERYQQITKNFIEKYSNNC